MFDLDRAVDTIYRHVIIFFGNGAKAGVGRQENRSPSGPLGKNTCHAEGHLLAVQWLLADRLRPEGNIRTSLRRWRRAYIASGSAVWHGSFASGASGWAAPVAAQIRR